eukprot:4154143-Pyramimonas_sp.AAC.1
MLPEAVCFGSEHSYACKELNEVPSGDQVDGSPPAPVHVRESSQADLQLELSKEIYHHFEKKSPEYE